MLGVAGERVANAGGGITAVVHEDVTRSETGVELGYKRVGVDREVRSWNTSQLYQRP